MVFYLRAGDVEVCVLEDHQDTLFKYGHCLNAVMVFKLIVSLWLRVMVMTP